MTDWPRVQPTSPPPPPTPVADHVHPVPARVQLVVLIYGLLLLLVLGAGAAYVFTGQSRDAAELRRIEAVIDQRTAARDAETADQTRETFALVCEVLAGDLRPSERTQRLARRLGCPEVPPPT